MLCNVLLSLYSGDMIILNQPVRQVVSYAPLHTYAPWCVGIGIAVSILPDPIGVFPDVKIGHIDNFRNNFLWRRSSGSGRVEVGANETQANIANRSRIPIFFLSDFLLTTLPPPYGSLTNASGVRIYTSDISSGLTSHSPA